MLVSQTTELVIFITCTNNFATSYSILDCAPSQMLYVEFGFVDWRRPRGFGKWWMGNGGADGHQSMGIL